MKEKTYDMTNITANEYAELLFEAKVATEQIEADMLDFDWIVIRTKSELEGFSIRRDSIVSINGWEDMTLTLTCGTRVVIHSKGLAADSDRADRLKCKVYNGDIECDSYEVIYR